MAHMNAVRQHPGHLQPTHHLLGGVVGPFGSIEALGGLQAKERMGRAAQARP